MSAQRVPIDVLLRGEDSGGQLAVIDELVPADFDGPPLHVHPTFDEGFYVLEGELTFQVRDELVTGRSGTFACARRGTPHTFANLSGQEARVLIVCMPAGFEGYFYRLAAQYAGVAPPPKAGASEPETRVVGPPLRS